MSLLLRTFWHVKPWIHFCLQQTSLLLRYIDMSFALVSADPIRMLIPENRYAVDAWCYMYNTINCVPSIPLIMSCFPFWLVPEWMSHTKFGKQVFPPFLSLPLHSVVTFHHHCGLWSLQLSFKCLPVAKACMVDTCLFGWGVKSMH